MHHILAIALTAILIGPSYGGDSGEPTPPGTEGPSTHAHPDGPQSHREPASGVRNPGTWVRPLERMRSDRPSVKHGLPDPSLVIEWPALDPESIENAQANANTRAVVTGLHRSIPQGYRGNLLAGLVWTTQGEYKQGTLQLMAADAESIRVQFRASLPPGSSLTFSGTANDRLGATPVWSSRELGERMADKNAIWSPSGMEGELRITVRTPASSSLETSFLFLERISHRWVSNIQGRTPTTSRSGQRPRHGQPILILDCPLHYQDAACHTNEYASGRGGPDMRGMVVHIHFERFPFAYSCSATLLSPRSPGTNTKLLLTANHCIRTPADADSIESAHYWVGGGCDQPTLDDRYFSTFAGADFLQGMPSSDQTLVELRGAYLRPVWLSGWDSDPDIVGRTVFSLHHPKGYSLAFSKGIAAAREDVHVEDFGWVRDAIRVRYYVGVTETGSSGSGLFYDREEGYLVGVLSAGLGCEDPSSYGYFGDFYPLIRSHVDPAGTDEAMRLIGRIPYMPRDGLPSQQGFVLLLNHSEAEATVVVEASGDGSQSFQDACEFAVPPRATRAFNSRDLEVGNLGKGCTGVGTGSGHWILQVRSDISSLDVQVYARALDGSGFLNSLSGTAGEIETEEGYWYFLPIINPASNTASRSLVRITNLGPGAAQGVQIIATDAEGLRYPPGGSTYLAQTLRENETTSLTAEDLENGNPLKLRGPAFGDGSGKWKLWIFSPGRSAQLEVTGLMTSRGLTSNLSR